jgi:exosortase/archaeosortase family protein
MPQRLLQRPVLWTALTASCALFYGVLLLNVEAPLAFGLFAALIWAAAALTLEDALPALTLAPGRRSAPLATSLLLLLLARGLLVQTAGDPFLAIAPPLFGLALAGLAVPPRQLLRLREPLQVLALTPLLLLLPQLLPNGPLSRLSAALSAVLLHLFGLPVQLQGAELGVNGSAVLVGGPCAGAELITQALLVGLLALILVPLPVRRLRLPLLLLAPLLGWAANLLRIALLALLAAANPAAAAADSGLFGFFHLGHGGLLFSGLAIALYGWLYAQLLERQLAP